MPYGLQGCGWEKGYACKRHTKSDAAQTILQAGEKSLRNGIIQRLHTENLRIAGQRLIEIKRDVGNGRIRRDNGAFVLSENHFVLTVKISVL